VLPEVPCRAGSSLAFCRRPPAGRRILRGAHRRRKLAGLAPGKPKDFYYAWPGEQSPVQEHETITAEIVEPEGLAFTGEASFDVGFEPAV